MKKKFDLWVYSYPTLKKLIMELKIAFFIIVAGISNALATPGYSQVAKVSLNMENKSLEQVMDEIESQSEFYFIFNQKQIDVSRIVNIQEDNKLITDILPELFEGTNVNYVVLDRKILLTTDPLENSLLTITTNTESQQNRVIGTVTDATTREALPGVNVVIQGTTIGTITDANGSYTIQVQNASATLQFSFIGYVSQEIALGGRTTLNVGLINDVANLDEVVVIGYGTQKRKSVTSSVSSINVTDAALQSTSSLSQALGGRAAGLTANITSAQPGGSVALQIRGSATGRSPLIVIDGMPTSDFSPSMVGRFQTGSLDATLSSLNPNDIESIDILKDASATAIYGSKAAGGVILITTKTGKAIGAESFSVDFSASGGIQENFGLPQMLSAIDYMKETNKVLKEDFLYNSRTDVYANVPKPSGWVNPAPYIPFYTDAQIGEYISGNKIGTDWLDLVSRTGSVQDYNLSVQGIQKNTRFFASFSSYDQKGIIENNELSKYVGRVNVDQNFGERISGGITINFSQINSDNVSIGNGDLWENGGILEACLQFDPTLPVRDSNGKYQSNTRQSNFMNPVSYLELSNITKMERFLGTAFLNYKILPGLSFRAQTGFDRNQSEAYSYLPTNTIVGLSVNGEARRAESMATNYQVQFLLNYIKTFSVKHNVSATLGTEYMKYNTEGMSIISRNYPFDGALWNNLALGADRPSISSNGGSSELQSYFLRASYDYNFKYFITANLRVDGSSKFSPSNQFAFFPGVSIGWDMARESFMGSSGNWLNQLKLRAGFGITGNDNIGTAFSDWYSPGANTMWGTNIISGVRMAGLGNPNLTWEKQQDVNFGIDFNLFEGRIYGSVDFFNRQISHILGSKNLLSYNYISSISYNLQSVKQTYGGEFTLNTQNIKSADFSWNSGITFTYYRDRWLKRDPSYVYAINDSPQQLFNELWYYKSDGLVPVNTTDPLNVIPGTIKILDVNGYLKDNNGVNVLGSNGKPEYSGGPDGKIDAADLVKIGVNIPITIGFSNVFNYKRFDLSIYTYGVFNRWKTNSTKGTFGGSSVHSIVNPSVNLEIGALNRYNSDHQEGTEPSSSQTFARYGSGDFWLEKAWFVRVRDITLGYTIPSLLNGKVKQLRLFCDIINPFIFTPYTGMDPETDAYLGAYPNQRTYMIGVKLGF